MTKTFTIERLNAYDDIVSADDALIEQGGVLRLVNYEYSVPVTVKLYAADRWQTCKPAS